MNPLALCSLLEILTPIKNTTSMTTRPARNIDAPTIPLRKIGDPVVNMTLTTVNTYIKFFMIYSLID